MPDDLNRLAAEAAVIDADAQALSAPPVSPEAVPAAAPPPVDYLTEARGVVGFICVAACAVFPVLEPIYTKEKQDQLAAVTAPLLEQYQVDMGGIMGKYGNWINFAMVALPLGAQTYQAMKAIAEQQANGKGATPAQQPALSEEKAKEYVAPVPMHLQPVANDAA